MVERKEKKIKVKKEKVENKKLSDEEFEKKVVELAGQGLTSEKIGEKLRKEGIHSKEYGKKISKILQEKNIYEYPDLKNVEAKLERVKKHYEKNRQDKRSMRERERIFSQLRRLKIYLGLNK